MRPKYVRMIAKMQEKEDSGASQPDRGWVLYILRCKGDTLYTGVTKDLKRRLKMHNDGKASKYTRARRPVKLIYTETCESRAKALMREYNVKKLTRQGKERLIAGRRSKKKG